MLLKDTARANALLSRLSSFLRYSLVGERGRSDGGAGNQAPALPRYQAHASKTSCARADVAPRRSKATSIAAMAIVENAIKYAVTPMEEGAEIHIDARVMGDRRSTSPSPTPAGSATCRTRLPVYYFKGLVLVSPTFATVCNKPTAKTSSTGNCRECTARPDRTRRYCLQILGRGRIRPWRSPPLFPGGKPSSCTQGHQHANPDDPRR